ncbi:MAG: VWA domain-containing protein [Chloroflexi bacterium]|nr:VWA domain-containing protein [Chloroflexota bacterium]
MRRYWKAMATVTIVAATLLGTSCAGAKPPPAPNVVTPGPQAASPPPSQPPPSQEVLIPGSPDTLISSLEPDKDVNIEFILDASGSMLERVGGRTKLDIAKEVIAKLVKELPTSLNLGLRAYGHRYPESDKARSCEDSQLLTSLGQGNADRVTQQLAEVQARGWTPIARAMELASHDVPEKAQAINSVILLSDGKETCDGRPTEVAQRLKEGPTALTVHTIGFAIDEETRKELQEVAAVSGGTYNEAQDAQSLLASVEKALAAARSGTFLRGEVLGEGGRRVATSLWLQDPQKGEKLHEFRSWLDAPVAPGTYDVIVGTAPRVLYRGVKVQSHTRTIIRLAAGALRVELTDTQGQPLKAMANLKDSQTGNTLRSFSTWYNQAALPGTYDVEVDVNPTVVRRISVTRGELTVIDLGRGTLSLEVRALGGVRPTWETELRDPATDRVVYRSNVNRELSVIAGTYRLAIQSVPKISLEVKIDSGQAKAVRLDTGLLRVELQSGLTRVKADVTLADASRREVGRFPTWEDSTPLAGAYEMTVHTQPEIRQQIIVSATEPTIIRLHSP